MFKLKKMNPPFGTEVTPFYEATYAEGIIKVIDGLCAVKHLDSRDQLLRLGYTEVLPPAGVVEKVMATVKGKGRR